MSLSTTGQTWDEASSPAALGLSRRFEAAWQQALADPGARRPDLDAFLADAGVAIAPGVRLALLRTEMGLRWAAGDRVAAADYQRRYPDLPGDALVALVYEEFCLCEEAGETPDPSDFLARHADIASQLRRVLDIHGLVGTPTSTTGLVAPAVADPVFPQAGETIAGFRLVEELGRGAFARVFLAEERQLADRPVALKVARSGSREPQTLARLQHTHIVPVHSYRTDPMTGLHLLCMPYFGRITLARLLADPKVQVARSGADVLEVLDRMAAAEPPTTGRSASRAALGRRTYHQAVAWWGARMAEALEHAHDHGVLHRDVKPSNVLVTRDGLPMLLDFNLAREVMPADESERGLPGGTLDYMAPEHLEELAEGVSDRVDARSDVFGLGVLLYEALAGMRPFPTPREATSASEMIGLAVAIRRNGAPPLHRIRPDVPAALAAVVTRCLAPDPANRYATAAELALDLQALADDRGPLFAREPIADRGRRWVRTNRRVLVMVAPVLLALGVIATLLVSERVTRTRTWSDARRLYEAAVAAEQDGDLAGAMNYYDAAARLAERPDPGALPGEIKRRLMALRHGLPASSWAGLDELRVVARLRSRTAELTFRVREAADAISSDVEPLRFRLTGLGGDLPAAVAELRGALAPFFVFDHDPWLQRPDLALLDDARKQRLVAGVNELMFLWALALDRDADPAPPARRLDAAAAARLGLAIELCDRALVFAMPDAPWRALRTRLQERLAGAARDHEVASPDGPAVTPEEPTALGCFQWGVLRARQGHRDEAITCFRKAVGIEPGNSWYQYNLASACAAAAGAESTEALRHFDVAVALEPRSPWVRFGRAQLYRARGAWALAMDDLQRTSSDLLASPSNRRDEAFGRQIRLELGRVRQALGDFAGARADYDGVIASDHSGRQARAARLARAQLDADTGAGDAARAEFDALVSDSPGDLAARLGRARLAFQQGHPDQAEADLTAILTASLSVAERADVLSDRALARLARGRHADALADADQACELSYDPRRQRLRTRAMLALGRDGVTLADPDEIGRLPWNGQPLRDDLRRLIAQLDRETPAPAVLLTRAVALMALGEHAAAAAAADRAVALEPRSARSYLIRARIALQASWLAAARSDIDRGRALDPLDPRLWELSGRLRNASGDPDGALADLDHALALGAGGAPVHGPRATARMALGDLPGAVDDWSRALEHDPDDPLAHLGRAEALTRLHQWEPALADLEQAACHSEGRPILRIRILTASSWCLAQTPTQLPRLLAMVRRRWTTPAPS